MIGLGLDLDAGVGQRGARRLQVVHAPGRKRDVVETGRATRVRPEQREARRAEPAGEHAEAPVALAPMHRKTDDPGIEVEAGLEVLGDQHRMGRLDGMQQGILHAADFRVLQVHPLGGMLALSRRPVVERRRHRPGLEVPPLLDGVAIDLDLDAVGVVHVAGMGVSVIHRAVDVGAVRHRRLVPLVQLEVVFHLEGEMVEPDLRRPLALPGIDPAVLHHRDVVVRIAVGQEPGPEVDPPVGFVETDHRHVEVHRAFHVGDEQVGVGQAPGAGHGHGPLPPRVPAGATMVQFARYDNRLRSAAAPVRLAGKPPMP